MPPSTTRPKLRVHQVAALAALAPRLDPVASRAWVVLPPGAGKTWVGVESALRLLESESVGRVVVFSPNTAIQGQWLSTAHSAGLAVDTSRDLGTAFTSLTYQSLAVFDADAEVDDDPSLRERGSLISQLHPNGQALVSELAAAGEVLLIFDECHHLLEVWGKLLADVVAAVPNARVLGLTATPPEALTADQAGLVGELFGPIAYSVSLPAVVRQGDLAPFAELAWLVTPTAAEDRWLAEHSVRFTELTTALTDPTFGSLPFLEWVTARFVTAVPAQLSWAELVSREPELCAAALRLHYADLLSLPTGARMLEEHRVSLSVEDWVWLLDDWLTGHLRHSEDPEDEAVIAAVRRALPAVGYVWTKTGIRRGRTPTDRVLARSEAKGLAAVEIITAEAGQLGPHLRMLVLADHERASATLPVDLTGVLAQQSGSALAVLESLIKDPVTSLLSPLLVTANTVAGAEQTLLAFVAAVRASAPAEGAQLTVKKVDGVHQVVGPWKARSWLPHVTRFFEDGQAQVLVGTRGLLGEGWDARRITGLIDLTTATSLTAVTQTRGRALRLDPERPDKVAVTWSVVCVSQAHPQGHNDWRRLVRKHTGFFGVDAQGTVADGVAHLDPTFSPYAAPPVQDFGQINARMLARAADRSQIATDWRVGEPYDDQAKVVLRVLAQPGVLLSDRALAPQVLVRERRVLVGAEMAAPEAAKWNPTDFLGLAALVFFVFAAPPAGRWWMAFAVAAVVAVLTRRKGIALAAYAHEVRVAASEPTSVTQIAYAVADALQSARLLPRGAEGVSVEVSASGVYRCVIDGVSLAESATFATALDEAISPLASPRYLIPRWVLTSDVPQQRFLFPTAANRAQIGEDLIADAVVWHAIPTVLGVNARRAHGFERAWQHWVGGGEAVRAGSAEGIGVLAAQIGADPMNVTTVMRRQWE